MQFSENIIISPKFIFIMRNKNDIFYSRFDLELLYCCASAHRSIAQGFPYLAALEADIFLSYRLLSNLHLSSVPEKGQWQGRSFGVLELLTPSFVC